MDIDLEHLLASDSVPDSTFSSVIKLLEDSLPAYRRDLAYGLANIRRIEQKYKQTRDEVLRQEQAINTAKSKNDQDVVQIITGDRIQNMQTLAKFKQEYESLTQTAQALKDRITDTEAKIQKIQAKRTDVAVKIRSTKKRKYYYMALGVIDSSFLVNIIEYPILQESILQHSQLPVDIRIRFKPIEVAAFALNRLPSMYVTTMSDYNTKSRFVSEAMPQKISDAVKKSIQSLRMGDPLHDSTPLPDELFCVPAGLLGCLSLTFNNKNLRWSDVPKLLRKTQEQRAPTASSISMSPENSTRYVRQSEAAHIQQYLQRTKLRKTNQEQDEANSGKSLSLEDKFLELYVLRGKLKYINAIEKLVVVQALFAMIDLFDEIDKSAAILADTLNNLTPMYTTSERGLNQLCKHFFTTQIQVINSQISKSSAQFQGYQPRKSDPLYFRQFNFEYQAAMPEITNILNRQDLSPENLVSVIAEFLKS